MLDVVDWHTDPASGVPHPERILTADIDAHFDTSTHGWRAHATPTTRTIDWTDISRPRLLPTA